MRVLVLSLPENCMDRSSTSSMSSHRYVSFSTSFRNETSSRDLSFGFVRRKGWRRRTTYKKGRKGSSRDHVPHPFSKTISSERASDGNVQNESILARCVIESHERHFPKRVSIRIVKGSRFERSARERDVSKHVRAGNETRYHSFLFPTFFFIFDDLFLPCSKTYRMDLSKP